MPDPHPISFPDCSYALAFLAGPSVCTEAWPDPGDYGRTQHPPPPPRTILLHLSPGTCSGPTLSTWCLPPRQGRVWVRQQMTKACKTDAFPWGVGRTPAPTPRPCEVEWTVRSRWGQQPDPQAGQSSLTSDHRAETRLWGREVSGQSEDPCVSPGKGHIQLLVMVTSDQIWERF